MALNIEMLANAIARLEEGYTRYAQDVSDDQIRDGLIQRFEFTYDLTHKMLRRALEEGSATPDEIGRMSFPTLIRTADQHGLTKSTWKTWHRFREMRNLTSHTYDERKALEVVAEVSAFLEEAKTVLENLKRSLG